MIASCSLLRRDGEQTDFSGRYFSRAVDRNYLSSYDFHFFFRRHRNEPRFQAWISSKMRDEVVCPLRGRADFVVLISPGSPHEIQKSALCLLPVG